MKMLGKETPKLTSPLRPVFAIEARISEWRKRLNELPSLIAAAEQSGDRSAARSGDETKVEREARALVRPDEGAAIEKPSVPAYQTLEGLKHERAVIERAIEYGSDTLADLRMAWAQQVMSERMGAYRQVIRRKALAIEQLRRADDEHQALLKLFGAAGRQSGLPCATVHVAAAFPVLKLFTEAALKSGTVTQKDLNDV